jgi:hypothetical protein
MPQRRAADPAIGRVRTRAWRKVASAARAVKSNIETRRRAVDPTSRKDRAEKPEAEKIPRFVGALKSGQDDLSVRAKRIARSGDTPR